jgi:putative membrane protein
MRNLDAEPWKGLVAGAAAGLAATWVMTRFHELSAHLERVHPRDEPNDPQHSAKRGTPESAEGSERHGEDATVRAADRLSRGLLHHPLSKGEKRKAGPAMHYGFGVLTGAAYGALAEIAPAVTRGAGAPFGTAVWLGADEVTIPLLKLAGPPWEHPLPVHARALAAHLVYGVTTEGVRRLLRKVF